MLYNDKCTHCKTYVILFHNKEYIILLLEIQIIYEKTPHCCVDYPKHSLVFQFLYYTDCRADECLKSKIKNVKKNGNVKIDVIGKGYKERRVAIPLELYEKIMEVYNGKEYIFETRTGKPLDRGYVIRNLTKASKHLLNGKRVNLHMFRHTRATHLLKDQNNDIKSVSTFLGHSTSTPTLKFLP